MFTLGFIIGGTVGVFFLVRDVLTQNNLGIAIIATVIFMFSSILIGEKFAHMVNCMLARITNQDAPSCVKRGEP